MDRSELIEEIKKQINEELKAYRNQLKAKIPEAQINQAKELKNSGGDFIKEHPWLSVSMAAFAGFVIARFFYKGSED